LACELPSLPISIEPLAESGLAVMITDLGRKVYYDYSGVLKLKKTYRSADKLGRCGTTVEGLEW